MLKTHYSRNSGYTVSRRKTARRAMARSTNQRVKMGPTTAKYVGLAALAVLAVVMLTQSSTNATNAYKQNELRKEISHVDQDVERLELEVRRTQSIQELQKAAEKNGLTSPGTVEYLERGEVAGASIDTAR